MNDQSSTPPAARQRILRPRRLALLASAGALGLAVLAAGPSGYLPSGVAALTSAAHAESAPNTAGFADLVAKVKPAVISVRVRIENDGDNDAAFQGSSERMGADRDSPFERFSRQFGFRLPASREPADG